VARYLEKLKKVTDLAVRVSTNGDREMKFEEIWFLIENVLEGTH
jgi:hypothetical protein